MDLVRHNKTVSSLVYHLVFCPKYRRSILVDKIKSRTEEIIRLSCIEKHFKILSLNVQPNHVHFLVSALPKDSVDSIAKVIKGRTSFILRTEFPELLKMPSLWTRSYFACTIGEANEETTKKYIEDQWKH